MRIARTPKPRVNQPAAHLLTLHTAHTRKSLPYLLWLSAFVAGLILLFLFNEPLRRSILRMEPLANALFIVLSWIGLGYPIVSRLQLDTAGTKVALLTSAALGCGLNTLLVFAAGIAGLLNYWVFLIWYLLGFFGFFLFLFRVSSKPKASPEENEKDVRPWNAFAIVILFAVFLGGLPYFVSPEVSSDALTYHLLIPKIFVSLEKIVPLHFIKEAHYPSLPEYNYIPVLIFFDEITCKTLHLLVGVLTLVAVSCIATSLNPKGSSFLAVALFLSIPAVAVELGWAWNDFFYTFFILLTLYYLISSSVGETNSSRKFVIAGIMAGLAGWAKYTFLMYGPVLLVVLLFGAWKRHWRWQNVLHFLIPVALISSVWMIRNYVFTFNPFYPFFNQIFQSSYWPEQSHNFYKKDITEFYITDWHWYTYLWFPLQLTFSPRVIDTHIGILPLFLVPLLFRKNGSSEWLLKVFLLATFVFWIFPHTGVRTLFPWFAILMVVAARKLQAIFPDRLGRKIVMCCLAAAVAANLVLMRVNMDHLFEPLRHFIGLETHEQYLSRMSPSQKTYDYLNTSAESGRVLLVSMHNPLYLRREAFFSGRYDIPIAQTIASGSRNLRDLSNKLRSAQIGLIAIDLDVYRRQQAGKLYWWTAEEKRLFEEILKKEFRPVIRFDSELILVRKS